MTADLSGLSPRLYEWECREVLGRTDQDVAFWLEVADAAPPPGGLLELACGTGRVTLPLADAGVKAIGLDVDPAALDIARRRRGSAAWPLLVAADMRRFTLRRRFAGVIIPYNSFQLLTNNGEAKACLSEVAGHLAPGGIFGLEVTDFQSGAHRQEVPDEVIASGPFDGEMLTLSGALSHDLIGRVSRYRRRFTAARWEVADEVVLRSYTARELQGLLGAAGFVARQVWAEGAMTRMVARLS